jgi:hypothetical protein
MVPLHSGFWGGSKSSLRLDMVTDGTNALYGFQYEPLLHEHGYDPYLMTEIRDGNGTVLLRNEFVDGSRVSTQTLADGQVVRYEYLFNGHHNIVETAVTLPNGKQPRFTFRGNPPGRIASNHTTIED